MAASVPYLAQLEKWLYEGCIEDPHDEFCVRLGRTSGSGHEGLATDFNDAYWDERYQLNAANVFTPIMQNVGDVLE